MQVFPPETAGGVPKARDLRSSEEAARDVHHQVFTGSGYDPQDVKVLFDPISYIIFDGLAQKNVEKVVLLADTATDSGAERIHRSIERTVNAGNLEFHTMRVDERGHVSIDKHVG